jgi:hypothetical protein
MFRIEIDEPDAPELSQGTITLGDYWEFLEVWLLHWSAEDYEEQWLDAAERLLRGEERAAFITAFAPPNVSDYLRWWPAWREGDQVHVSEQLLMFGGLSTPFNETNLYQCVGERQLVSADEHLPISYWTVHLDDLREFVRWSKERRPHGV